MRGPLPASPGPAGARVSRACMAACLQALLATVVLTGLLLVHDGGTPVPAEILVVPPRNVEWWSAVATWGVVATYPLIGARLAFRIFRIRREAQGGRAAV